MKKKICIAAAILMASFVILAVLFQGNIGATIVVIAILAFGSVAGAMSSAPAKSSRWGDLNPKAQELADYNQADLEAIASLTCLYRGSLDEAKARYRHAARS